MALPALDKIKVHPGHCYLRAPYVDGDEQREKHLAQALIVSRISFCGNFRRSRTIRTVCDSLAREDFYLRGFRPITDHG